MHNYTAMMAAQHTLNFRSPLGVAVDTTPGQIVVANYHSHLVHILHATDRLLIHTLATTKASGVWLDAMGRGSGPRHGPHCRD